MQTRLLPTVRPRLGMACQGAAVPVSTEEGEMTMPARERRFECNTCGFQGPRDVMDEHVTKVHVEPALAGVGQELCLAAPLYLNFGVCVLPKAHSGECKAGG